MPMAAFQQLVKLLPAVAGGELLKIDGGGAVGDVGNAGACVSKHSTDRIAHKPKVTTFVPPKAVLPPADKRLPIACIG